MKIKLSHILIGTAIIDAVGVVSNIISDKPLMASIALLATTIGWLLNQVQLEKLRGE